MGFTWPTCCQAAGALLPHRSTLTLRRRRFISVALSLESPPPAVSRHSALRCPDFPQRGPFGTPLAMIQSTPLCYYNPFYRRWQGLFHQPIIFHTFGKDKFHLRHNFCQPFSKGFYHRHFRLKMAGINHRQAHFRCFLPVMIF